MAAITLGNSCDSTGGTWQLAGYTLVDVKTTADGTGTIDYICITVENSLTELEIATFLVTGGDDMTVHGSAAIGALAAGKHELNAPGDFTAFNVETGDYQGVYGDGGKLEAASPGGGYWYENGNFITPPCSEEDFGGPTGSTYPALYMTGTEAGGEYALPMAMNFYRQLRS